KKSMQNNKMVNRKTKKSIKTPKKEKNNSFTNEIFKEVDKIEFSKFLSLFQDKISIMRNNGIKGALLSQNVREKKISSPFHVLIGCIISLRTKDTTTGLVLDKLFKEANSIESIANLSEERLQELIYPAGFYRNKSKQIKEICNRLLNEYDSAVPDTIDELLKFKGVGRKTANLVVTLGFGKPGICVDTHVQRITHRIGFIKPKKYDKDKKPIFHSADETEMILRKKLDKKWWIDINDVLVTWGQTTCAPVSPKCSQCIINTDCLKVGVVKSR
ncbi:MAG: endonuclease III, partial [Candidatus Heimdallarchaeota archaeon]